MVAAARLKRSLWLLATVLAVTIGVEGLHIARLVRYDGAVRANDLAVAAKLDAPEGAFAAALAMQRKGDTDDALRAYGTIGTRDTALHTSVQYNLANLYLRRALELGEGAGGDVVGPLVELAKQGYRDVLRTQPHAWDAKYNLELALSVQPDIEAAEAGAEAMPEHSRRAVATQRKYERLP
jgi:mxaK protein